jgi:hypothetical protein
MTTNEMRWEQFAEEVAAEGIVWTIEKEGEYVGQSGFCKGFKVLISHRFPSKFDVVRTSNERGCGIYDYQQAYRKIA